MFIEERHQAILHIIGEKGRISVGEIQDQFCISADSARRDLRILDEKGLVKKTHGGAIPPMQVGQTPPRVRDMKNMTVDPYYAVIAKKGAAMVRENDIVYLTSGSVGFVMLEYLPRDFPYTLVLNSATLADEFKYWDNVTVYLAGGKMRMHGTTSFVDSFATAFVGNLHFDLNLMTAAGVDARFGVSNGTDETATFQRTVIGNTMNNVLLMPCRKVGFKAFVKVCDANRFQTLITDWDADEEEIEKIRDTGVEVVVTEKESEN